MYKEIYKKIKKYDTIVITRHIGADPDALGAQLALKDIIQSTFPEKKIYAIGAYSSKFKFIGTMDKVTDAMYVNSLVIVLDTPIRRRIDAEGYDKFTDSIKIDHHPYEETICNLEWIDDTSSSSSQMILELCNHTKHKMTKYAAERLFLGIVFDTNRFLYYYCTPHTLHLVANLIEEYEINTSELYEQLYMRDMSEMKLQGYISQNMTITENNVGYICITDDIIKEYGVDAASAGNMVSNFTYINELLVWVTFSEDVKQNIIRVSIRSRGPAINAVANQYNGGGHKFASGIRIQSFNQVDEIIGKLDRLCKEYKESQEK
jgi:phosphoesterase RecJ-like protein